MQRRAVTVQQVASRARVSVGTVSHVLSGRRFVAPNTRARVEKAMAELGYRPNRVARSLSLRRTQLLGMVVPDVANPFFAELARAVDEEARAHEYCVVLGNTDNDPEREATFVGELAERGIDGLLVAVTNSHVRLRESVRDLPVVAVDRLPDGWQWSAVLTDNHVGMRLVVDHLAALGHRRIGFVGGLASLSTARERAEVLHARLAERGLLLTWERSVGFSMGEGAEAVRPILDLPADRRPTALVAANDLLAMGVLNVANQHGVRVPDELSVVGYDDITFAAGTTPPLTTVRQPIAQIGRTAAELLLALIEKRHRQPRMVRLPPELVIRSSSGPPPA